MDWKKSVGAVQHKMSTTNIQPFLEASERWFKKQIGTELWAYFTGTETNATTPMPNAELIALAKQAICWRAYVPALSQLKLRVGDAGLKKSDGEVKNDVKLWEYNDSIATARDMLNEVLEDFWTLLYEVAPTPWKNSDAYKTRQGLFVRSAAEMTNVVPMIQGNVRLFEQMVGVLRRTEDLRIRPLVTGVTFDALKVRWQTANAVFAPHETELIRLMQHAIVPLAVQEVWGYLPVKLDGGIKILRQTDGAESEFYPSNYDKDQRNNALRQLALDADLAMTRLQSYLDATASTTVFASYRAAHPIEVIREEVDYTNKTCVII